MSEFTSKMSNALTIAQRQKVSGSSTLLAIQVAYHLLAFVQLSFFNPVMLSLACSLTVKRLVAWKITKLTGSLWLIFLPGLDLFSLIAYNAWRAQNQKAFQSGRLFSFACIYIRFGLSRPDARLCAPDTSPDARTI